MKVLQTVSQANSAKTVQSTIKAMPKQASRVAATFLGNLAATKIAFADDFAIPDVSLPAVDAGGITDLIADNPILVGGGALLLALPVGINAILNAASGATSGPKATTVPKALQALEEDARVVLVDVRNKAEIKSQGSPDLRAIKRSVVSVPYTSVIKGGDIVIDEDFAEKFARAKGISEESLVIVIDADGSLAKDAAEEISEIVEKVYYLQGGAEVWAESGPWRAPSAGLSLPDLRSLGSSVNNLAEDFKKAPTVGKAGLAAAAIAGAGVLIFNEVEVVLELAGLVAGGNFLLKLLFADERQKVVKEVRELVDEKVAIQDVGSDLNRIAKAIVEDVPADAAAKAESAAAPAAAAAAAEASSNGSAAEGKPENAAEAAEWIENWKAKSSA